VTDEALMLAVRDGDVDRLSVLFERYHRQLFGFFFRMLDDRATAEDLVQDVFVRVLKYRHTFKDGTFKSWLFEIARNAGRDAWRRPVGDSLDTAVDMATSSPGPVTQFEQREEALLLKEALRRLPADKRELIVLARYRGLDYGQLAVLMQSEVGTMRVRLHRAIRQLGDIVCQLQQGSSRNAL
jgi:RNA polymerase sigma factor (sigma-70 family)